MNIIIFTKRLESPGSFVIQGWHIAVVALCMLVILPGAALYTGKKLWGTSAHVQLLPMDWQQEMKRNRAEIAVVTEKARKEMNALAMRLGQLQAQSMRLNALGQRLVDVADLDQGEFDFSEVPGVGGALPDPDIMQEIEIPDFVRSLDQLAAELDEREQRLRVLESLYMSRSLDQTMVPSGRPVRSGWISSRFGVRADPFTGNRDYHRGMDFAGKEGTEIHAVASGIVTWSDDRYDYGNMVEINHGNGYITRYAHNKVNLVKPGDVVEKGQVIALLGSSGRSTAPHVHFEVIKNGRGVDPLKYVRASR